MYKRIPLILSHVSDNSLQHGPTHSFNSRTGIADMVTNSVAEIPMNGWRLNVIGLALPPMSTYIRGKGILLETCLF